ncbi:mCG1050955 [Mus musculus]|nr:mCG1050955 [Mus musculus]
MEITLEGRILLLKRGVMASQDGRFSALQSNKPGQIGMSGSPWASSLLHP